jgi:hypothetical protein
METTTNETSAVTETPISATTTEIATPYVGPFQVVSRTCKKGPGKFHAAVADMATAEAVKNAVFPTLPAGATVTISPFVPEPVLTLEEWTAQQAQAKRIADLRAELKAARASLGK